jgi:hypothetical protein
MMQDVEALDILRAEGHAVSTPDAYTGRVRIWIRGSKGGHRGEYWPGAS